MRKEILRYLPQELAGELGRRESYFRAEELRLRADRPAEYYADGREIFTDFVCTAEMVQRTVFALSEHSLPAYADELKNGYFTVGRGVRIGVAGRAVSESGRVVMMRDYSSVNIRFPQELRGICRRVTAYLQCAGRPMGTLIISAPQNGKTTLLRDLIRAFSNGEGIPPQKCAVIDERCEISGGGGFDLGLRTDVLLGCPKSEGIRMALRALSPQVIATDEIGSERELEQIFDAAVSGVIMLATAHAGSPEELQNRMFFSRLYREGIIRRTVLLSDSLGRGTVQQIYDSEFRRLLLEPFSIRAEVRDG